LRSRKCGAQVKNSLTISKKKNLSFFFNSKNVFYANQPLLMSQYGGKSLPKMYILVSMKHRILTQMYNNYIQISLCAL